MRVLITQIGITSWWSSNIASIQISSKMLVVAQQTQETQISWV
jgi:hypothetical protein